MLFILILNPYSNKKKKNKQIKIFYYKKNKNKKTRVLEDISFNARMQK